MRLLKKFLILFVFTFSTHAFASEAEQGVDIKYMYYWDRNDVWNNTPAINYFKKFADYFKFTWDQELDVVSGASRRLGLKNIGILGGNDVNVDAVSSASKSEFRHSEQATLGYANKGRNASASFYFSDENDYRSYAPSASASIDLFERNTTLAVSGAWFFDAMTPTGAFAGLGGNRRITSVTSSITQLFSPLSLGVVTANVIHSSGYLGHPYTPVITNQGAQINENLPDLKTSYAFSAKGIQGFHLFSQPGSLHLEGRYYFDDWELKSQTADLQWYQYFDDGAYFRLRARAYHQDAAAFAKDSYNGAELYRTPDLRFYEFSSVTLGFKLGTNFPESWNNSPVLPDRWDVSYDQGIRNTKGEEGAGLPYYHYQLFPSTEYYMQGTLMVGLSFDL